MYIIKTLEYANREQLSKWLNSLVGRVVSISTERFGTDYRTEVLLEEPKVVSRVQCSSIDLLAQIQRLLNSNQTVLALEKSLDGYSIITLR